MFRKISVFEKTFGYDGGAGERKAVSQSSVKSFSLTISENFREESFKVSLVSGNEMFLLRMVMSRFSVKNFVSQFRRNS